MLKGWGIMRIFISHSSKDKDSYCNLVVDYLIEHVGRDSIVYDQLTFEAGEKSIDEIDRMLKSTDLFVILLSSNAIESDWVKYELKEAHKKLSEHSLNRIYPLIIDKSLKFSDERIPAWLRDYNLKYIARPKKSAKLIVERAKDVNWSRHPDFQNKGAIFVGRNELIDSFEKRIDDFDEPPLNTFIVSGLPNIGRKSLARQCLIKGTIIPQYYEFPTISLNYQESIEDFIVKLYDLSFAEEREIGKFLTKTMLEKIELATELSKEISDLSEIVLIKDEGCIVDYRGNISDWFKQILLRPTLAGRLTFIVITKYKTNFESVRGIYTATYVNVPELNRSERNGLLKRLAQANKLSLSGSELESISVHLTGYPAQVHYAIELIKNNGYPFLKNNFKKLSEFNEQEVSSLLEQYKDDDRVLHLLALISRYDAISINMLYEILNETDGYIECFEQLSQQSFFELEGVNKEYVRLNEVIRNYISRSGNKVLPEHHKKALQLFENVFSNEGESWYNSNDFLLAIRETITQGKQVQPEYIIPSVYLKSMLDLYSNMQYESVVSLARLAINNSNNTDKKILREIRYQLCSALAKLRNAEFLSEVQKLDDDVASKFLTAFYYRQIGKNSFALERLNELLEKNPDMSKAKREKVLVLKNLQEYEDAMGLAKENFYLYSDNPYHIQAYFECLINTYYEKPEDALLQELLKMLKRIKSDKAQSMYCRCNALYLAYVENNYEAAIFEIEKAIQDYPRDIRYTLSIKFDIARLFHKYDEMEKVIKILESDSANSNSIVVLKSRLLADKGDVEEAVEYFMKNIKYFTDESKKAFCEKLKKHV